MLQTVRSTRAAIADDDGVAETLASLAGALAGADAHRPDARRGRQLVRSRLVCSLMKRRSRCDIYANKLNLDPDRLQEIEARLSALFNLARKLRVRPDELQTHWQAIESKFEQLAAAQGYRRTRTHRPRWPQTALTAHGGAHANAPLARRGRCSDRRIAGSGARQRRVRHQPDPAARRLESTGAGRRVRLPLTYQPPFARWQGGVWWRAGPVSLAISGHLRRRCGDRRWF